MPLAYPFPCDWCKRTTFSPMRLTPLMFVQCFHCKHFIQVLELINVPGSDTGLMLGRRVSDEEMKKLQEKGLVYAADLSREETPN